MHISHWIIFTDLLNFLSCSILTYQYLKHRKTGHQHQYPSTLFKSFILLNLAIVMFASYYASHTDVCGKFGLFFLDLASFIWVISSICGAFRCLPQCSLNFIGLHFSAINDRSVMMEFARVLGFAVCGMMEGSEKFHFKPLVCFFSYFCFLFLTF